MWKIKSILLVLTVLLIYQGCKEEGNDPNKGKIPPPEVKFLAPAFNADSAYAYVEKQLSFGPRIPNSTGHRACSDWMIAKLQGWADKVTVQETQIKAHDGTPFNIRNIIASFKPDLGSRVLVSAHWDSRPYADQEKGKEREPVPAANDGASGAAVMMEMARQLKAQPPTAGVDFIFFDAEDYGAYEVENSFCLGSQYWAKNPHTPGYHAKFGMNLDMVGAEGARFYQEGFSLKLALGYVNTVWTTAHQLGYGEYFPWDRVDFGLTDDHFYVADGAGIPMVEIAHYDPRTNQWFPHWHKTTDDLSTISKPTLKAVGQTVLEVVCREK